MFDEIEIDGSKVKVYFDIERFKLKIDRYDFSKVIPTLNDKYIQIKNFILFIKYIGNYNNYSYEYNVLFYIHCDYINFLPSNLNKIVIGSKEISYLLYSENKRKTKEYFIEKENCKFKVILNRSNKIEKWYYNDIKTGGNIEIKIEKCNDWETYGKIINSVVDAISVCTLNRRKNDFEILLFSKPSYYIGSIVFQEIITNDRKSLSIGNIDIIQDDVKKIISTLVEAPMLSNYIIPRYSNYYNQLEFYKLYACFEYEYKKIDKDKMYDNNQKEEIKEIEIMKKNIQDILKQNSIEVTEHYINSLNNYNPMEGHKKKLYNAFEYSKKFMSQRYSDINLLDEKKFINYIYKTRIKIIHEPNDNIEIENPHLMGVFNEMIYGLFLKRCGITDKRIQKICREILIPYV